VYKNTGWVQICPLVVGWVGLGCVSQLMGWVGSGHTKWTHGQLCDGAEKVVCPTQTSTNNIGPHSLLQNHSLREKNNETLPAF